MKIVFDTNIFISALLKKSSTPAQLIQLFKDGKIEVITSSQIIQEVERVLKYPKLTKLYTYSETDTQALLNTLWLDSTVVEPAFTLDEVPDDKSDNKFLEAAITGKVSYIVTGDAHLLRIGSYRGIQVLTPAQFLQVLSQS